MHTPSTQRLQQALKNYAGVTGEPTFAEYIGYVTVDAFVQGLKAAGKNPTPASFINAMQGIRNYTADGLFDGHSIGFAMDQRGKVVNADNCLFFTQYSGTSFHLVPGEDPLCGSNIPGETIASAP
jgi:branched-chain amino acid transport system substrate-binding protein